MAYAARSPNFVVPRYLLRSFYIITLLQRPISWIFHKMGLSPPFTHSDHSDDVDVLQPSVPVDLIQKILPVVKFEDLVIDRSKSRNNNNNNNNKNIHEEEDEEDEDEDRWCAVCLCKFEKEDEVRGLKECFHIFHRNCLDSWMDHNNNSCPLCRTPIFIINPACG